MEGNIEKFDDKFRKVELKNLPSRGLGYPEGTELYYKPYTWGEVKELAANLKIDATEKVDKIISGIEFRGTAFNAYNMSYSDLIYMGFIRHVDSTGNTELKVPYVNPYTQKDAEKVFDVTDIEFDDIADVIKSVPFTVEFSSKKLSFGLLTVNNVLKLIRDEHISPKGDFKPSHLIASMVRGEADLDKVAEYMHTLGAEDGDLLDDVIDMLDHNIKPLKFKINTDKKGETKDFSIGLARRQALVVPFRKERLDARERISFS